MLKEERLILLIVSIVAVLGVFGILSSGIFSFSGITGAATTDMTDAETAEYLAALLKSVQEIRTSYPVLTSQQLQGVLTQSASEMGWTDAKVEPLEEVDDYNVNGYKMWHSYYDEDASVEITASDGYTFPLSTSNDMKVEVEIYDYSTRTDTMQVYKKAGDSYEIINVDKMEYVPALCEYSVGLGSKTSDSTWGYKIEDGHSNTRLEYINDIPICYIETSFFAPWESGMNWLSGWRALSSGTFMIGNYYVTLSCDLHWGESGGVLAHTGDQCTGTLDAARVIIANLIEAGAYEGSAEQEDTCTNGKQDASEEGIDCGGVCDTACVDTCTNKIQDKDEEGIDCGGLCKPCSYSLKITPSETTMYATGKDQQLFTITVTKNNEPAKGITLELSASEQRSIIYDSGKLSASSATTDSDGKATVTYTAATSSIYDKAFGESIVDLDAMKGRASSSDYIGGTAYITLLDPRPKITITKTGASVLQEEGAGMAYVDIAVDDKDSKKWTYSIKPDAGKVYTGGEESASSLLSVDSDDTTFKFNWIPPQGTVELRDYMTTLVKGQRDDLNSLQEDLALKVGLNAVISSADKTAGKVFKATKKDYDYIQDTTKSIGVLAADGQRILSSVTVYEAFLNMLSGGVEVLEVTYGTKSYIESKIGPDKGVAKEFIEDARDAGISYGCNSLQTGLRTYADAIHEANLETITIPIHVEVTVEDEDGYKATKDVTLYYTYYFIPNS